MMDALALLCTLHADGPATLKRLRQVGCSTLEELDSIELERLAELLGSSPAAARRFAREAKALCARVGDGWLEREDTSARARASAPTEPAGVPVAPAELDDDSALSLTDTALVQRVLSVWRERDQVESPKPADAPIVTTAPAARVSAQQHAPLRGLTPDMLDGLDAELCVQLAEHGIQCLEELVAADTLALANALDVGYTRLSRLKFLGARALAQSPPRRNIEKLSPSEKPSPDSGSRIELEPLLDLPRAMSPAMERRALSSERRAPSHMAAAAPREDAGGPFV